MITALLLTSLTLAPTDAMAAAQVQQAQQRISVWLSERGDLRRGDRVRVYVRPEVDGYLLVLHAEPDGRIRVLFPLDPYDDNYVRGARDYEIEGRGGREAFRVYERDGVGTVFAAFSRDPFTFDAFVRDDHWDYRLLEEWRLTEDLDPETELTALTRNMASDIYFDYDLTSYFVGQEYVASHYHYSYPRSYGISVGFGNWYPWSWRVWAYSSSWVCSDPFWWDSYRCGRYYWGYDPYVPYWYDPWYSYRYARAYYYYPYYRHYYYPARYVYAGPTRLVLRRYTFKSRTVWDGGRDAGITARRRFVSRAGGTRAVQTAATPDRLSLTRRTPTRVLTTGRRVTPDAATRVAPTRRTVTNQATPARRDVRPDGWGITDGRRTITPKSAPPRRATPSREPTGRQPAARPATPTRQPGNAQPTRSTTPRRGSNADPKPMTPTRRPTSGGTATPTRRPTPQRSESPARRTTPSQRSTPSRATPSRATPTRRTTPSRSTPSRATPSRPSTPSRTSPRRPSTPSRATPSRPSTPSRTSPRRPSTPSRATPSRPSTPSRATPSRPSAPSRSSPRRPSTPSRSTPSRSSGRSSRRPNS
ncbi:MAG: DUF4384 domain-containing protein [Gemmatimonadales bacterium]